MGLQMSSTPLIQHKLTTYSSQVLQYLILLYLFYMVISTCCCSSTLIWVCKSCKVCLCFQLRIGSKFNFLHNDNPLTKPDLYNLLAQYVHGDIYTIYTIYIYVWYICNSQLHLPVVLQPFPRAPFSPKCCQPIAELKPKSKPNPTHPNLVCLWTILTVHDAARRSRSERNLFGLLVWDWELPIGSWGWL